MTKKNRNKLEPNESRGRTTSDAGVPTGSKIPENYIDPILEAVHRVWHVRDPVGNASGPFKGKELRRQLDSGTIGAGFDLCREDWEDWRKAAEVFPELGVLSDRIPIASASVFTDPSYQIGRPLTEKTQRALKKKRQLVLGIVALVALLLITVGLCYLLATLV